jgi:hypothetical protein
MKDLAFYRSLPFPRGFDPGLVAGVDMDMDAGTFLDAKSKGFVFETVCPGCGFLGCVEEFVFYGGCTRCMGIEEND